MDFLTDRSHYTAFRSTSSSQASITAGIVQGSVLGPSLFNMVSSSLQPVSPLNKYFKYADDGYLVVPCSNSHTIQTEILHHSDWAKKQNLKINISKTKEIVFRRKRSPTPPISQDVERVNALKILGIIFDEKLTFESHVVEVVRKCTQSFFALRTFRSFGLSDSALMTIFIGKILSVLTYASPAWWGFASKSSHDKLGKVVRKAIKFHYYNTDKPSLSDVVENLDRNLFKSVTSNQQHCLRYLLPPVRLSAYNMRSRGHSYRLPNKDDRNFINRCLYKFL